MATVQILLTFDDGPSQDRTPLILAALANPPAVQPPIPPIKAAFFVQTHFEPRLPHPPSRAATVAAIAQGHVIAIHTGSFMDHACHKLRAVAPEDPGSGHANGLDSDMRRAQAAITSLLPATKQVTYVRATHGARNQRVLDVYLARGLRHVHWHVPSGDADNGTTRELILGAPGKEGILEKEIKKDVHKTSPQSPLVILFHDVNRVTADHLPAFIAKIHAVVNASPQGHTARFCQTYEEVEAALEATHDNTATDNDSCPKLVEHTAHLLGQEETLLRWPIKDAAGDVIIGYRHVLRTAGDVRVLPPKALLRMDEKTIATADQRLLQWTKLREKTTPAGRPPQFYESFGPVPLRIRRAAARLILLKDLEALNKTLQKPVFFPAFAQFPQPARQALLALALHFGEEKLLTPPFATLVAAVRAQQWQNAANAAAALPAEDRHRLMWKGAFLAALTP